MYKKLCIIATVAVTLFSCQEKKYIIDGTIDKSADGETVYLQKQMNDNYVLADSAVIHNGTFKFKGIQDSAVIALLSVERQMESRFFRPLFFILENGKLKARIDTISTISGTSLNDRFQTYMNDRRKYDNEMEQLSQSFMNQYMQGGMPDSTFQELKKKFEIQENELKNLTANYVKANTNNVTGPFVFLQNSFLFTPEEQSEIIDNADSYFKDNSMVKGLSTILAAMKKVAVGMPYIDLKMENPDGRTVRLSDYLDKGKYILVDFWASWCAPCRKQMPELVRIYNEYKGKNFDIVGVSFDTNRQNWLNGLKDMDMTWPQMSDLKGWESQAVMLYGIQGIPHTILLGPDGKIIAKDLKGEELTRKLNELLK